MEKAALALFERGTRICSKAGIILVDTKYEFGLDEKGKLMLIDEIHTPDSSRFWKSENYKERFEKGQEPENFDKEFVRISYAEKGYRGEGEIPGMPPDLWVVASQRYITLYEMLTGSAFEAGEYPVEPRLISNMRVAYLR